MTFEQNQLAERAVDKAENDVLAGDFTALYIAFAELAKTNQALLLAFIEGEHNA